MNRLLLAVCFCGVLSASTLRLTAPTATVTPGQIVNISVVFADGVPTESVAGLQFKFNLPALVQAGVPAGNSTSKSLSCGPTLICLFWGLNQTTIPSGTIATLPITLGLTQAPGPLTLQLSDVIGTTAQATAVNVEIGPALTLTVLNRFDLNSDGQINQADVVIAVAQANGAASCGVADLNTDGKCDLIDVYLVIKAALGI